MLMNLDVIESKLESMLMVMETIPEPGFNEEFMRMHSFGLLLSVRDLKVQIDKVRELIDERLKALEDRLEVLRQEVVANHDQTGLIPFLEFMGRTIVFSIENDCSTDKCEAILAEVGADSLDLSGTETHKAILRFIVGFTMDTLEALRRVKSEMGEL